MSSRAIVSLASAAVLVVVLGAPGPASAAPPDEPAARSAAATEASPPRDDYDRDGIPNIDDDCPTDPGVAENGGCPGAAPSPPPAPSAAPPAGLARVRGARIVLDRPIEFASGSARPARANRALLDDIAKSIASVPSAQVIVRGHTDDRGRRMANIKLSRARARAVVRALHARGVALERLHADGVGPDVPIADNQSAEGRARNRRVEFVIIATPK